jgi:hypothetical protein
MRATEARPFGTRTRRRSHTLASANYRQEAMIIIALVTRREPASSVTIWDAPKGPKAKPASVRDMAVASGATSRDVLNLLKAKPVSVRVMAVASDVTSHYAPDLLKAQPASA